MTEGPGACPSRLDSITVGPTCGRAVPVRELRQGRGALADRRAGAVFRQRDRTSSQMDMYWHTDPNERGRPQSGTSSGYGWTVDRMRALGRAWTASVSRSGTSSKSAGRSGATAQSGGGRSRPPRFGRAVWHSIIAGARGILYFQHSVQRALRGRSSPDAIELRRDARRWSPASTRRSGSLAPVLNSAVRRRPVVTTAAQVAPDGQVARRELLRVRRQQDERGAAGHASDCRALATRPRPSWARAGSIPVSGGQFTDNFADGNADPHLPDRRWVDAAACRRPEPPISRSNASPGQSGRRSVGATAPRAAGGLCVTVQLPAASPHKG